MTTMTRREFATHMGWKSQSNVNNLAGKGLIVFTNDGKRVEVEASEAKIIAACDPSKAGVRARHAAARGDVTPPEEENHNYQNAKARKEHYAALQAEMDYRKRAGELMEADDVRLATANIMIQLRSTLEPLGAVLAPQLAATASEAECRGLIEDRVRTALSECSRQFERMQAGE